MSQERLSFQQKVWFSKEGPIEISKASALLDAGALKEKICLLYCASGMRSRMAVKQLKNAGLAEVYNLGGIARGRELMKETKLS